MDIRTSARLTPRCRERTWSAWFSLGQTPKAVSVAVGVCPRAMRKWVDRYDAEGLASLQDRSSRPHRLRAELVQPRTLEHAANRGRGDPELDGDLLARQALTARAIRSMTGWGVG